jgi:hypothetical protein
MFERVKQRGRPPTRCQECRDLLTMGQIEMASQVNPDTIYNGPKEALKGDKNTFPHGNEAQSICCWRIFTSDSAAEAHKFYHNDGSMTCRNPADLGMVARERRGLPIWTRPSDRNFDQGSGWDYA